MKKICFRIIITSFLLLIVFTGCASTSDSSRSRTLTLSYYMSDEQIDSGLIAMAAEPGNIADAIEAGVPIENLRELFREYLSEQQISEDMTDEGFTSWHCVDFVYGKKLGLEFGYYSIDGYVSGFVLYDGKDVGELAVYNKLGLEHHWGWTGPYGGPYSFVITPEGYGRYYDFTNVPDGESIKPRDVYKVRKR